MIFINAIIIKIRSKNAEAKQYLKILKWFFILSMVYIVLLPLGGYRSYRPNIIRMDTIMPVTLGMFLFYGFSTFHIIKQVVFRGKILYYIMVVIFAAIFINADTKMEKQNKCEYDSLVKISKSTEEIILLDSDCSVLSWGPTKDYRDSEVKTELLRHWGITKEKKFFYQK
jgi:amino acid transporter